MRATWLVALLMVSSTLVGCIGSEDPTSEDVDPQAGFEIAWGDKALPFGPGHDHEDRAHHRGLSTPNFDVVGYTPLNSSFYGAPAGAYFCGDAKPVEDGRRLAVVESRSDVAFALADVTDPADPKWLGELVMPTTHTYDLAVAPDGQHVILVTSEMRGDPVPSLPLTGQPDATGETDETDGTDEHITWRSPCTDGPRPVTAASQATDPVPRPMSILLVDISDPREPTVVEQQPLVGSGHSVFSTRIDDRDWIMVTTTRMPGPLPTPGVDENGISAYEFYELGDGSSGPRLELLSIWRRPPSEDAGATEPLGPRGHDGWLSVHPETDQTIAYLAGGDRFTTLDLSDPRNPVELGRWTVTGEGTPGEGEGTMHSAYPIDELLNGRHYTVIGPEHAGHPSGYPSGLIFVLDTTDPSEPTPVAGWTLPYEVEWNGTYMFSNHYLSVVDETLFVSMYHGGIWAVDLSPIAAGNTSWRSLDSMGVFLADTDPPEAPAEPDRWAPIFEEILDMPDGSLVTFDGNSGLYTLTFDQTNPAPSPEPWPIPEPS